MSRLNIKLLGAFRVNLDGKHLRSFGTDKVRALLAYLAVEAHRPHRREHLAGVLWSDQAEKKALHSLRQSLSTLRKALDEDPSQPPFLLVNRETIQFNSDSNYWLDIAEFRSSLDRGLPQNQKGQIPKRPNIPRLQYALSLYRGNFLDQFILKGSPLFDEWAIIHRELLTRQAIEAMCTLIDYHERRGEFEQACKIAEQIVSIIPWEENAHRVVMRMLAQAGQWSAVEVQYQNIQRYLEDELGVEPSPETMTLLAEIREKARENQQMPPRFSSLPNNLPFETTPFVGRKNEMEAIVDLLTTPKSPCITLVGPGGIGKSRLALAVAKEQLGLFEHGVFFIPLTSINSAELLTTSIAEAIGFSFYSSQDPTALLTNHLRQKSMLLVLDNFEHLLGSDRQATELLVQLLKNAPGLITLVTSRQPLNLRIEQIFEVRGLAYPNMDDAGGFNYSEDKIYSALQLFNQVASRVDSDFSLKENWKQVIKICQLLEGLPLGIELSATWVRGYEPEEIASQIEQNLDFLATTMRDVPARHRSIRSVFNHSWQRLNPEEKSILQKLTVFQGSFSRNAAEEITGANMNQIFSLIDQSLLQRTSKDRYEMHNLLRQFAAEKLAQEPRISQKTHDAHCIYYAKLVQSQKAELHGSNPIEAQDRISVDIENIRTSWQWASEYPNIKAISLAAKGLGRYYDMRSWFAEGRETFARAAKTITTSDEQPREEKLLILATVLKQQAWYEVQLGNYQPAISLIENLIPELNAHGFLPQLSAVLNILSSAVYELGDYEKSKAYFNQSLEAATQTQALVEMAFANSYLGNIARVQGEFTAAKQHFDQSLANYEELGDQWGLARVLNNLGSVAGASGNYAEAEDFFRESLSIRQKLGDQSGIAGCLHNLSILAYVNEDYAKTKQLRQECLTICREIGFTWGISSTLKHLGDVEKALGNLPRAKEYYLESLEISQEMGDRRSVAFTLNGLGTLALLQKDYEETRKFLKNALKTADDLELVPLTTNILIGIAELWMGEEKFKGAYQLLAETLSQPGIEKQTQDKGEQIKVQIESHLTVADIEKISKKNEEKLLDNMVEEVLKILSQDSELISTRDSN